MKAHFIILPANSRLSQPRGEQSKYGEIRNSEEEIIFTCNLFMPIYCYWRLFSFPFLQIFTISYCHHFRLCLISLSVNIYTDLWGFIIQYQGIKNISLKPESALIKHWFQLVCPQHQKDKLTNFPPQHSIAPGKAFSSFRLIFVDITQFIWVYWPFSIKTFLS